MSSPCTPATAQLTRSHVVNLLDILRRANTHYSQLAATFRASLQPTHHARKRAHALKLSVSIQAALNLDPKQISVIPLPVLDRVASPPPAAAAAPARPLPIAAPAPRYPSELSHAVVGREREIKRLSRPVLRCAIPSYPQEVSAPSGVSLASPVSAYSIVAVTPVSSLASASALPAQAPAVLRGKNVPWRPVTSRWSMTTVDMEEVNEEEDEEDVSSYVENATIEEEDEDAEDHVMYSSDYDDSMDLPTTPEFELDADEEEDCAFASLRPRIAVARGASLPARTQPAAVRPRVAVTGHARKTSLANVSKFPPRLDVPVDVARLSWGSDISSGLSSGSSSGSSSRGPLTPMTNEELPKLMIRIKRKSGTSDIDMADDATLEKRPKYERKEWVTPATRRTVQRTTSHRKVGN